MNAKIQSLGILFFALCLVVSGCGPGQLLGPTITPSPTLTLTPTSTPKPTFTPQPTATPTPKPSFIFGRISIADSDQPFVTSVLLIDPQKNQTDFETDAQGKYKINLSPGETYSLMVVILADNPALASCRYVGVPNNDPWSASLSLSINGGIGTWTPQGSIFSEFTVKAGEELEMNLAIPCNCDDEKNFCVELR